MQVPSEDTDQLMRFVGRFIDAAREYGGSDIDGGDAQDWMLENGLLETRQVTEACGESCECAEWDDFPQDCFFVTALGKRCQAVALSASRGEQEEGT